MITTKYVFHYIVLGRKDERSFCCQTLKDGEEVLNGLAGSKPTLVQIELITTEIITKSVLQDWRPGLLRFCS